MTFCPKRLDWWTEYGSFGVSTVPSSLTLSYFSDFALRQQTQKGPVWSIVVITFTVLTVFRSFVHVATGTLGLLGVMTACSKMGSKLLGILQLKFGNA